MTIRLYFKDTAIRDDGQFLCLTDMWRAGGADPSRQPAEWLRSVGAQTFIEALPGILGIPQDGLLRVNRGGSEPGTWAHWQVGMAYAKYLSPTFHAWCNDVVRAVMRGGAAAAEGGSGALVPMLTAMGEAIARLAERVDSLMTRPYGQVARHEAADIKFRLRRAARRAVALKQESTERRARAGFDTRVRAVCHWHGAGSRWEALPSHAFAWADKALSEIERELERADAAQPNRQLSLPEKSN